MRERLLREERSISDFPIAQNTRAERLVKFIGYNLNSLGGGGAGGRRRVFGAFEEIAERINVIRLNDGAIN